MKITLTGVWHKNTDKDGKPLMSKTGKPYERCSIKAQEYGDKYISGFGNKTTKGWNVGDSVEVEIETKGEYLNFSLPKQEVGGFTELDREMLRRIDTKLHAMNSHIIEIAKKLNGGVMYQSPEMEGIDVSKSGQVPDYPEDEINPEDIPF